MNHATAPAPIDDGSVATAAARATTDAPTATEVTTAPAAAAAAPAPAAAAAVQPNAADDATMSDAPAAPVLSSTPALVEGTGGGAGASQVAAVPASAAAPAVPATAAVVSSAAAAGHETGGLVQPTPPPSAAVPAASRSLEVVVPSDAAPAAQSPPISLAQLLTIKQQWEAFPGVAAAATTTATAQPNATGTPPSVSASLSLLWSHRSAMTMQLLRDSGIGRALNALKKKVVGADNALAHDLLASWKASSGVAGASPSVLSRSQSGAGSDTPSAPATPRATSTGAATLTLSAAAASSGGLTPSAPSAPSTPLPTASPSLVKSSSSSGSGSGRSGGLDLLGESRKRKAEQLQAAAAAAAGAGGERKRISLMPPGAASARPQFDIPYPVALPAHATPPAPCLPSEQAFFARPAPPAAPAAAAAASKPAPAVGARKSLPSRSGPMTTEELRARIRLQLCRAFDGSAAADATDFANEIVETAAEIEGVMFDMYKDTGAPYRNKSREVAMNLSDTRNPELKQSVMTGVISVHSLLTLPFTELASSALKLEREAAKKWEMAERRSDVNTHQTITDAWRCGKCRERKCTYYQMQTRSADEPMTTFVRCVNCGNRWRC